VARHEKGIPVFAVVGAREEAAGTVTLRDRAGARQALASDAAAASLQRLEAGDAA